MGKRGPRPRPATLHRLKGTFRGDRHARREPDAPGPLLRPPPYLNPRQRRRFHQILAEAPRNLLRRMDAPSVAGFIVAESLLAEATEARARELDNGALLDRSEHGQIILDALVKLQLRALAAMKPYIDMLGFSPSSRVARSTLTPPEGIEAEPPVPRPVAISAVSPWWTWTRSGGRPNCSATICA